MVGSNQEKPDVHHSGLLACLGKEKYLITSNLDGLDVNTSIPPPFSRGMQNQIDSQLDFPQNTGANHSDAERWVNHELLVFFFKFHVL